jgi:hypothetical protein
VTMSGSSTPGGGWLVRITDRGQGVPEPQLRRLNELLAQPPLADAQVARHLGLFAVAHLAARHGIRVEIMQPPGGGTTVAARIPAALIMTAAADRLPSAPRFAAAPVQTRLASFQRGSRRARAVARTEREAKPAREG